MNTTDNQVSNLETTQAAVDKREERIQAGLKDCESDIRSGHTNSVGGIFQIAVGVAKASELLGGSFRFMEWIKNTIGYKEGAASKYKTIGTNEWLNDKKLCDWSKLPPSPWTIYELAADKRIMSKIEFKKVMKGVRPDMTREELRDHLHETLSTAAEKQERKQAKDAKAQAKDDALQQADQREREHANGDPLTKVSSGSSAASVDGDKRVVEGASTPITGEDETPLQDFELKDDNSIVFESEIQESSREMITASFLRTLRRLNIAHHEVIFRAKAAGVAA